MSNVIESQLQNEPFEVDFPIRTIILARNQKPHVQSAAEELTQFLEQQSEIDLVGISLHEDVNHVELKAELAIVLGGDGSILRACRQFGMQQIPMLPVNLGRLGFLADFTMDDIKQNFHCIVGQQLRVRELLMFECTIDREDGTQETHLGLNEVAIIKGQSPQIFDVHLTIENQEVTTYSGDGLIISTPVGSTAHSLSAGGPILRQSLAAFVVTPICAHTLSMRPIVDSAEYTYQMTFPRHSQGLLAVIDGHVHRPISGNDVVTVRQASVQCQLIRFPGHSYYSTLHRKLGWGGQLPPQQYDG